MIKPTFAQLQHFFRLVEEKKITADNFQLFLGNPNKLFFEDDVFPVSIDYKLSLDEMVEEGKYDMKTGITPENFESFKIEGSGTVEAKLRLMCINRPVSIEEVDELIESFGLMPAKIEHLLAFGAKYPDKQREFSIIAPCSGWVIDRYRRKNRTMPSLHTMPPPNKDGERRRLHVEEHDDPRTVLKASSRYLVVSK